MGLVGILGDAPGASGGGVGGFLSFLTDVSSLPPRVAPCRVSDFFSHHARAGMQLVGTLTTLVLLSFLRAISLGGKTSYSKNSNVIVPNM